MKFFIISLSCLLSGVAAFAQPPIDTVLKYIVINNREIEANGKWLEAEKWRLATGNTLSNPVIEYDHLPGLPAGAGTQREMAITQSFNLPMVYAQRKKMIRSAASGLDLEQTLFRQQVLLDAKLVMLELVALKRKIALAEQSLAAYQRMDTLYRSLLEQGAVNSLDANRLRYVVMRAGHARLALLQEQKDKRLALAELNGGEDLLFREDVYPEIEVYDSFDRLDEMIEASDPQVKQMEAGVQTRKAGMALERMNRLPKMEFGYHSQSILGQSYKGVHAGIVLPLWESKNKLKAARSELSYAEANEAHHRMEHRIENLRLYTRARSLEQMINAFRNADMAADGVQMLETLLREGGATLMEFLSQSESFRAMQLDYIDMELEYHTIWATLLRYRL